jgi:O-antigen/teichoic acid export membrane protein
MLQDSLDRVLVARWAGLTAAGYYQVARTLWEILGTLNAYPFQLLFSRLSRLFTAPGGAATAEVRRLFASAMDRLLFIAVPAAFGLWALRQPIITVLYGEPFLPAAAPLMVVFPCWVFIRWTRELAGIGFQPVTVAYLAGFAVLFAVNEATRAALLAASGPGPAALAGGMALALVAYAVFLWSTHTGMADNLRYARELVDPRRFLGLDPDS